jgi:hypothetical protein
MLNEFQLAEALEFPVKEMTEIAIKKRMRVLIGQSQVPVVKISRNKWCVSPESIPTIKAFLWQSKLPSVKPPRSGNSGVRLRGKPSSSLQEYLTPVEKPLH